MQFYWEDNPIPATQESLKMTCRGTKFKTRTWIPECVKIAVMIPPPHPPCGVGLKMIFFNLSINHNYNNYISQQFIESVSVNSILPDFLPYASESIQDRLAGPPRNEDRIKIPYLFFRRDSQKCFPDATGFELRPLGLRKSSYLILYRARPLDRRGPPNS